MLDLVEDQEIGDPGPVEVQSTRSVSGLSLFVSHFRKYWCFYDGDTLS